MSKEPFVTAYNRMKCNKMFEFVLLKKKITIKKGQGIGRSEKSHLENLCYYYYNYLFTSGFLLRLSADGRVKLLFKWQTIW